MNGWLIDTNVLSELRRPKPERKVVAFFKARKLNRLHVSVVTIAEIRYGIESQPDAAKRAVFQDWLANSVKPMFEHRIFPVTDDIMLKWLLLVNEGRKVRHTFSQPDLIIAATALHHGLTLATRNTADFAKTGVTLFNPWLDPPPRE